VCWPFLSSSCCSRITPAAVAARRLGGIKPES
jgi:hypothetical protein